MSSRVLKIVGLVVAVAVAACVDLSSPKDKPASISQVQLPAFFVVQGDTMRDTLGRSVAPSIIAFDAAGGVLTSFESRFFLTDSVPSLKINPDGTLSATEPADTAGATTHIVGQIASLATATQTIFVTVRPDTLERAGTSTALDSIVVPFGRDSASSIGTVTLSTVVHGVGGRIVPGVFVRYALSTNIASNSTTIPAGYLRDDGNKVFPFNVSTPDTGDASGVTSRTLVVNSFFLSDPTIVSSGTDTLVVTATAMYKGAPLANAPLQIRIPLRPSR